jgi:hypothetical protein
MIKPIASAYGFIYYGITDTDFRMGMGDMEFYLNQIVGFGFALTLPIYYAMYAISKADHRVWQTLKNTNDNK